MSMLKSTVAKVVAAAVAATAGTAAFAATGPNEGSSDLFIAVWNPGTSTSYVQDLGSTFSFSALATGGSFNTSGFTASTTVDGGSLSTAIGSGTYDFALFAGNLTVAQQTFSSYAGDTMFFSSKQGNSIVDLTNGQMVNNGGGDVATYIDTNLPGATQSFTAVDTGTAASKYWASAVNPNSPGNPAGDFTIASYQGHAVGAGGLNLVQYLANSSDVGSDFTTSSFVGSSNANPGVFTFNDSTDVLTYSDVPAGPVPLPAAGWLLVSALLGLGAVGRRKATAA